MKVLHVCDWHLKYAAQLARGLADGGHDATLLTRTHDLEFGGTPGAMRAYVRNVGGDQVRHVTLPGRMREVRSPLWRVRAELRRLAPDIVHYQETVGTDLRLLVAAGLPWKRFAVTVHDPVPHPGDEHPLTSRTALRLMLRGAGVVFVHSDALRDELADTASGPLPPIEVVPHGVADPQVEPLPDTPSLLFFGRIATYYKGLDVLLDAMPLIWRARPDVRLTVAGAGDVEAHPTLEDPRVLLRNQHVPDAELTGLFAAATCCVLPYRQASQSGVGSHAKAFGRPIVATRVGGLPELVGEDAGRIVEPGDPGGLAEAVLEILTTPGLAEAMGRAAAASVTDAGWRHVGELTARAYRRHLLA